MQLSSARHTVDGGRQAGIGTQSLAASLSQRRARVLRISKTWRKAVLGVVILAAIAGTGAVVVAGSAGSNTSSPGLIHDAARQVGLASFFDGHGGPGRRFGRINQDNLAQFLGLTPAQFQSELSASGATMATVAQAHGKSRDELKAFIQSEAKSETDQAVSHGVLTRPQADRQLSLLAQRLDRMIDRTRSPTS